METVAEESWDKSTLFYSISKDIPLSGCGRCLETDVPIPCFNAGDGTVCDGRQYLTSCMKPGVLGLIS